MKPAYETIPERSWGECSVASRENVGFTLRVFEHNSLVRMEGVDDSPDFSTAMLALLALTQAPCAALKVLGLPSRECSPWVLQPVEAKEGVLVRLGELAEDLTESSSLQITWGLPAIAERFWQAAEAHRAAVCLLSTIVEVAS